MKITIDDPHFAARCLDFMNWTRFKHTYHIEESILQEFLALCLMKDIQIDIIPNDEKKSNKSFNNTWKWKGN